MKSKILPGFEIAGPNAKLVTAPSLPTTVLARSRSGKVKILREHQVDRLKNFRVSADLIRGVNISDIVSRIEVNSWDELSAKITHGLVSGIWDQIVANPVNSGPRINTERIEYDSFSGAAQISAFLEVIPHILCQSDLQDPAESLETLARRSKAFILHSAGLDDLTEAGFTYGLASPKPDIHSDFPHSGIRYNPKWFEYLPNDTVGLNNAKVADLRSENNKHPTSESAYTDVWFGCPALKSLSPLYDAVVTSASQNGLFEQSYISERRQLGY